MTEPLTVNRRDLERVVGPFVWVETERYTKIQLDPRRDIDEARLMALFPGYVAEDRGPVLELRRA